MSQVSAINCLSDCVGWLQHEISLEVRGTLRRDRDSSIRASAA